MIQRLCHVVAIAMVARWPLRCQRDSLEISSEIRHVDISPRPMPRPLSRPLSALSVMSLGHKSSTSRAQEPRTELGLQYMFRGSHIHIYTTFNKPHLATCTFVR
jgi:hypothetical protein